MTGKIIFICFIGIILFIGIFRDYRNRIKQYDDSAPMILLYGLCAVILVLISTIGVIRINDDKCPEYEQITQTVYKLK